MKRPVEIAALLSLSAVLACASYELLERSATCIDPERSATCIDPECTVLRHEDVFIRIAGTCAGELSDSILMDALCYYGVECAEIVLAQAKLETGNYNSKNCLLRNNLFGLYCTRTGRYYEFGHWSESVIAYMDMIQRRYLGGDYYEFLDSIGYAEDGAYTDKLRRMAR